MARLVMKFGGTSLADPNTIYHAATRVRQESNPGDQVVVVVSAMAGVTNQLGDFVNAINPPHDRNALAEYDVVVSSGEQVTSGLMALALQALGMPARSMMGWQVPVKTDDAYGKARITDIPAAAIEASLNQGSIVVIPGFQGMDDHGRITTLGRGGSDTSAVALAVALNAERCDIFTDVDGVYNADPRIVAKARKLDTITFEEMLEMASLGSKVLQTRAVEMAMKYGVRLHVRSTFDTTAGTLIVGEEDMMERALISGIAYNRDEAKLTLLRVPDHPGVAASIFGPLAEATINVDMIVQNVSEDGQSTDLTFTVARCDLERAAKTLESCKDSLGYGDLLTDQKVVKLSVVGVGMRSHAGIAQRMFATLAEKGINIQVISTSEIKISILIAEEYGELALQALHAAYEVDPTL